MPTIVGHIAEDDLRHRAQGLFTVSQEHIGAGHEVWIDMPDLYCVRIGLRCFVVEEGRPADRLKTESNDDAVNRCLPMCLTAPAKRTVGKVDLDVSPEHQLRPKYADLLALADGV